MQYNKNCCYIRGSKKILKGHKKTKTKKKRAQVKKKRVFSKSLDVCKFEVLFAIAVLSYNKYFNRNTVNFKYITLCYNTNL